MSGFNLFQIAVTMLNELLPESKLPRIGDGQNSPARLEAHNMVLCGITDSRKGRADIKLYE